MNVINFCKTLALCSFWGLVVVGLVFHNGYLLLGMFIGVMSMAVLVAAREVGEELKNDTLHEYNEEIDR